MMMSVSPSQAEEQLHHVAEQLTQWRQSRSSVRGSRIPVALWSEILQVAEVFSVSHVAKFLRLKPQAVKRRREETEAQSTAASLQFVEVTPTSGQAGAVAVEVQRPDGARFRITYRESAPALASLLQMFLEGR
jgi:hypothetical protein